MANITKWGKDRLKQAKGAYAQLNPFDGGRTYDTNQRGATPGTKNPVNIKADDTPGFQLTNNSVTRGLSRAYDQVNQLDSGRTWKQRAPVGPNRNIGQQLWNTGVTGGLIQGSVQPIQRLTNTAVAGGSGAVGLANAGIQSIFGSDEDYQRALQETRIAINEPLVNGWGGRGGYMTPEQAASTGTGSAGLKEDFLKPLATGVAEVAPVVVPFGATAKGASLLTKVISGGAQNAVVGGATDIANQWVQGQPIDYGQAAKSTVTSGVIGGVVPTLGPLLNKAKKVPIKGVTKAIDTRITKVIEKNPAVRQLDETMTQINTQRGVLLKKGLAEDSPELRANNLAFKKAVQEKLRIVQSIKEGGYIEPPKKKPDTRQTVFAKAKEVISKNKDNEDGFVKIPQRIKSKNPDEEFAYNYLEKNKDKALKDYVKRTNEEFGNKTDNIVAGDDVKFIVPKFGPDKSTTYHEPASRFAKQHYDELLNRKDTVDKDVLIMAGGTGSGKTTALKGVIKNKGQTLDDFAAVIDTNLTTVNSAKSRIDPALESGRSVNIQYVYRDPIEAFKNGVIPRALKTGRMVLPEVHGDTHAGSMETVIKLAEKYKDDPRVNIEIVDNSQGKGKSSLKDVYFLQDKLYNKNKIASDVTSVLDDLNAKGELTNEQYKQFTGKEAKNDVQGDLGVSNREPQRQRASGGSSRERVQEQTKSRQSTQVPLKSTQKSGSESSLPFSPLNADKFNVSQKAKKAIVQSTKEMAKEIETKVGKRLTNKEVRELANTTGEVLKNSKTRSATKKLGAARLRLADDVSALAKKQASGKITEKEVVRLNQGILELKAAATDAGRTLQLHKEIAQPREVTVLDVMMDRIQKQVDDLEPVKAALAKLGSDSSPQAQAEFYRTFVKATKEDWLDKFRYTNMLSSPLTHIVNISSNLSGVGGISPIQKVYEGAVDFARSKATGGPRTRFAGEAVSYYKGVAKALPNAIQKFKNVMEGKELTGNADFDSLKSVPLATKGAAGKIDKILSVVPKLLEASDQFATTLSKGGEVSSLKSRISKGIKYTEKEINDMADDAAKYRVFRQELGKQGQGHFLDFVDFIPKSISKARSSNNPVTRNFAKYTFPFVNTPTNLFKQGLEYSPAGILTLHGNTNKTAQAAKMLMGTTTMTLAAGAFAANDAITFGEPTDSKQRDAFRAEGKQPYAVKIGNKWYSYSKTHPAVAFNLAMVAAYKEASDKGTVDQSALDKFAATSSGVLGFFRDQSYLKSVGDMTSIMQAKDGARFQDIFANQATNTANQLSPFKSMVSWAGRMLDPTQRKVDYDAGTPQQIWQGIIKDIPGLNKNVPARINPFNGEPIKNGNPVLNSFSPIRVTNDKGFGNTTGLSVSQRQIQNNLTGDERAVFRRSVVEKKALDKKATDEKDTFKKKDSADIRQLSNGKYYAKIGTEYKEFTSKTRADEAVQVEDFKSGDEKKKVIGSKVYLKADNDQGYTVKSKKQYDYDLNDSKLTLDMDRAKGDNDVNAWLNAAEKKYLALQDLRDGYDPEIEQEKINEVQKKMEDLRDTADKYQGYGGFKKGKKGSKKNGFQAPSGGGISLAKGPDTRQLITSLGVKARRTRRKF